MDERLRRAAGRGPNPDPTSARLGDCRRSSRHLFGASSEVEQRQYQLAEIICAGVRSAIAAMEQCSPVPDTPDTKEALIGELKGLVDKLRVHNLLKAYSATIDLMGSAKDAKYFLMSLQPETARVNIWQFKTKKSELADAKYTELEQNLPEGSPTQIVLVSADNISALKRAYPNYFLDTNVFGDLVTKVLKGQFGSLFPIKPRRWQLSDAVCGVRSPAPLRIRSASHAGGKSARRPRFHDHGLLIGVPAVAGTGSRPGITDSAMPPTCSSSFPAIPPRSSTPG